MVCLVEQRLVLVELGPIEVVEVALSKLAEMQIDLLEAAIAAAMRQALQPC